MWEHLPTIITIASFILTAGGMLVTVTWRLSVVVIELKEAIAKSRDEIEERQEIIVRQFGETAQAIRQKIHEVETWARDEFVKREDFYKIHTDLIGDLKRMGDKIEARLERMETKIDAHRGH